MIALYSALQELMRNSNYSINLVENASTIPALSKLNIIIIIIIIFIVSATLTSLALTQKQFGLNLQMPSVKFTQCQTVSRNILRSSPNANVQALWKNTSTGPNLQYDIYRNTKEVLKAVKLGNKERLTHNLPSQGALLSFLLIIHSKN